MEIMAETISIWKTYKNLQWSQTKEFNWKKYQKYFMEIELIMKYLKPKTKLGTDNS